MVASLTGEYLRKDQLQSQGQLQGHGQFRNRDTTRLASQTSVQDQGQGRERGFEVIKYRARYRDSLQGL